MNYYYYLVVGLFFVSCNDLFNYSGIAGNKSKADSLKISEDFDAIEEGQDRTVWQKPYEVIHLLGSLENMTIADIGAGSGYFAFRFLNEAGKVIAIDIEPELILMMNQEKTYYKAELRDKFEARLAQADDPKLSDHEVDVVFVSNTYTMIPNRIQYLKNLIPKFKDNGKIMVVDFKKKLTPIGPTQKNRMAQSEVELELLNAGYELVLSDDRMLEYQYIIIAQPAQKTKK